MSDIAVGPAVAVLNGMMHRGAKSWRYGAQAQRVMPEGWNGLGEAAPPCITVFECMAVACRLVAIGPYSGRHGAW